MSPSWTVRARRCARSQTAAAGGALRRCSSVSRAGVQLAPGVEAQARSIDHVDASSSSRPRHSK
jgi:hypothetical protein